MHVEIELQSSMAKEEIFELRQFLHDHLEGVSFHIKSIPAQEGQMVAELLVPVLGGIVEAIVGLSLHEMYNQMLKPAIDAWLKTKKSEGKTQLGVVSTFKTDEAKVHFLESSSGESKVYDHVNYAIDTDKTYAVLIGAEDFEGGFSSIPPVKGNLEDLYRLLTDKLRVGLPKENVFIVHNKVNTEIEEVLLRTSRLPGMETLILYFAGHGFRTDIKKLFLVARNTRKIDDYVLGGIDFDFINQVILKSSTAKQKILILDACHSGIATQGTETVVPEMEVKGTYMLTSSPGDEVSYFDKNLRNTYFTGSLLDILNKGIDNSNEMLALDDLFEHAQTQLLQRNFPQPISKSQLNIPPSRFFLARNPAFSIDKLKSKPGLLFSQGLLEDALYEYEVLLQKYPDDLRLRKEAEHCRAQVFFTQLVNDADELFYQHQNYPAALEKYRKAAKIKPDDVVQNKIRKCEERMHSRTGSESGHNTKGIQPTPKETGQSTDQDYGQEQSTVTKNVLPPVVPQPSVQKRQESAQDDPTQPVKGSNVAILIAVSWVLLVGVLYTLQEEDGWDWYFPTLPVVVVTGIVFGRRLKKMSITEMLLYAGVAAFSLSTLAVIFTRNDDTMILALITCSLPFYLYFRLMMNRIKEFNLFQFGVGCLVLIFMSFITFAILFTTVGVVFEVDNIEDNIEDISLAGAWTGAFIGVALAVFLYKKWKAAKKVAATKESNT